MISSCTPAVLMNLGGSPASVMDDCRTSQTLDSLPGKAGRLPIYNYLFSIISTQNTHETELKALEERWEGIVGLLGRESFPEFLRVFWNSRNKLARKSELFKTIRKRIDSRDAAFQLLRDLDQSASVYAALRDPQDAAVWNLDEQRCLKQLMMFNVRQPLAVLMACQEKYYEADGRFSPTSCGQLQSFFSATM